MGSNPSWRWVSTKEYSRLTGMAYASVLSLCKNNKIPCVEKEGGNKHKQYYVQYFFHNTNEEHMKILEECEKLKKENALLKKQLNEHLTLWE